MEALILRFEAPMMSFGGPIVDRFGKTLTHPTLSMITGLIANALGYEYSQFQRHQRLQARLDFAARLDRQGVALQDYQTVDLGSPHMLTTHAWTSRGRIEKREGSNATGTHIRIRDYLGDASYTVALSLAPKIAKEDPELDDLGEALQYPSRPLFLGRKCCPPAARIYQGVIEAKNLLEALEISPLSPRADSFNQYQAWWPARMERPASRVVEVWDRRDWANQIHTGTRFLRTGSISVGGA